MKTPHPLLTFSTRRAWRYWLARHHASTRVAWLVYFKQHTAKPTIPYEDSVEEALCFGWIDSTIRRIDEETYARKFTPRRPGSPWSALNLIRARRMIREGRMAAAGLAKVPRVAFGFSPIPGPKRMQWEMPAFFQEALAANPKAREYFNRLDPSYRRSYIGWLASAKTEETRQRRLREALGLLERGKKLGMK